MYSNTSSNVFGFSFMVADQGSSFDGMELIMDEGGENVTVARLYDDHGFQIGAEGAIGKVSRPVAG